MPGFARQRKILGRLGPHKTSVSCLYIKRLEDVDQDVLRELVEHSLEELEQQYPAEQRKARKR